MVLVVLIELLDGIVVGFDPTMFLILRCIGVQIPERLPTRDHHLMAVNKVACQATLTKHGVAT
jgi:hypothetical protein